MTRSLFTATVAAALSLAICEAGLRFLVGAWPFEPAPVVPDYLAPEEASLRWRFAPGKGRNRLGFRNPEIGPKPEGTLRVLFLGDSLFWASRTSSGRLYPGELADRWTAVRGAPVETINAGVPGYTTYQELELLKIHGLGMAPDLVVLGFVLNDLHDPYLHRPNGTRLLGREPAARRGRLDPSGAAGRWLGWSFLAHEVVWRAEVLRREAAGEVVPVYEKRGDFYLAWQPWAWTTTRSRLREMKEALDPRNVPLVVVVFPMRDQFEALAQGVGRERSFYPQRRIERICDELGLARIDLAGPIEAGGGADLYVDHAHLGRAGNDIVREMVGARLDPRFRSGQPGDS